MAIVTLLPTLTLTTLAVLVMVFCGWRGARPLDIVRGPRMVPWRFLMVMSAAVVLVLTVHLANLVGITTGR